MYKLTILRGVRPWPAVCQTNGAQEKTLCQTNGAQGEQCAIDLWGNRSTVHQTIGHKVNMRQTNEQCTRSTGARPTGHQTNRQQPNGALQTKRRETNGALNQFGTTRRPMGTKDVHTIRSVGLLHSYIQYILKRQINASLDARQQRSGKSTQQILWIQQLFLA